MLEPHTTKYCVDKFCGETSGRGGVALLSPRVRSKNYGFRGKMCWAHDTTIFTMLYLILLTLWFHEIVCWALEKPSMRNFLGNFSCALSTIILWSTYEQLLVILAFYFDLFSPFYFLKLNRFFSTFIPVLRESRHYFNYLLSREVCTNLQVKRFPRMKLWYTNWMYEDSEFQNNNIKKLPPHVYLFWNCLSRNLLIIRLIIITLF